MSNKKTGSETDSHEVGRPSWAGAAAVAGAAIGSAALAAAMLYVNRRKDKPSAPTDAPAHPENAPETD